MDKLHHLLDTIQNDTDVRRFKELEKIIDQNKKIQQTYQKLLAAQKHLVQTSHDPSKDSVQAQKTYDEIYQELLSYPPMQEYLDLLELINNDLSLIQDIIENELDIHFD